MCAVPTRTPGRSATRRRVALLAALALWAAPSAAVAAEPGMIVYDVVIVRPLAAVHTLVGAIFFIPAGLFAWPSGTVEETFLTFVGAPTVDLYRRPLGEF